MDKKSAVYSHKRVKYKYMLQYAWTLNNYAK
jgi:hypothetical protein